MTISRLRSTVLLQVEVYGYLIEKVVIFKYMDFWISFNLSWTKHVEITCYEFLDICIQHLHCIAHQIQSMYKPQVLPILDNASVRLEEIMPRIKKE